MLWDNHSKDLKRLDLVGVVGQVGNIVSQGLGEPISSSLPLSCGVNSLPLSCAPNMVYYDVQQGQLDTNCDLQNCEPRKPFIFWSWFIAYICYRIWKLTHLAWVNVWLKTHGSLKFSLRLWNAVCLLGTTWSLWSRDQDSCNFYMRALLRWDPLTFCLKEDRRLMRCIREPINGPEAAHEQLTRLCVRLAPSVSVSVWLMITAGDHVLPPWCAAVLCTSAGVADYKLSTCL